MTAITADGISLIALCALELVCSLVKNFAAEEKKVNRNLQEIVKQLVDDKTKDGMPKTTKRELHDELEKWFKGYVLLYQTLPLPSAALLHLNRPSSLKEISSQVGYIFKKFSRHLNALKNIEKYGKKEEEGSSVPGDSALIQRNNLVEFDGDKEQLIQLLLKDDSERKNVLVTGRQWSRKMALVRKVCEDVHVKNHFGTIAWISVPSTNDLNLIRHEIFLQLLLENEAPIPDHLSASDVNNEMLRSQIISLLQKERCLIVVDHLVDQSTFKTFQNASSLVETGWVIFIDRDGHQSTTYEMQDLSEYESRELFHLKAFPKRDVPSSVEDSKRGKPPRAIHLFSRLLLRNMKIRDDESESMIPFFDLSHVLRLIEQVLKTIYTDDGLGSCLLYLSIFPENSPISRMRISRLWTAEGFLNLEKAEHFLQDFLDKKLIHPVETRSDGGLSTFRVDSLVREIIVSFSEGYTNWPERVRYLSVRGIVKDNEKRLSQLCSLFMFNVSSDKDKTTMSEASPSKTSENQWFPCNVKLLKVLDLTGIPPQIARDALFESTRLKYFRDTSIEVIPSSIKRLAYLEFLDLKSSLVTELPKEVGGLERIRHILIYHHEKDPLMESYNLIGFKALCSIEGLKRLEKLCFVEADDSILQYLGTLTKLMRLGITKLREEDGKRLCTSLEELKGLESLNLHAFDEDEMLDLHHLSSPPEFLKRLYLHGRLDRLPNWISSLHYLTKMVLRWSNLEGATQQKEDLLATLGKLPELVELELRQAYNGRQLDFKKGQFPKLKILLLDELGRLRSMSLEEGTMPCLEDLTISRCQWLERIPTGIEHIIPTLKALEFFDMSCEFYKMVPDDYRNSKGKPKVYFTQWRPGQWKTIPWGTDECDECFAGEH